MPFYAEYLWQAVKEEEDAESVHLAKWPEAGKIDETLLESMEDTRNLVTSALEARVKAGIKVRQPVTSVSGPAIPESLAEVVLDELNAKEYKSIEGPVAIDTQLTKELVAEGAVRELMRAVQGERKNLNLVQDDEIVLSVATTEEGRQVIEAHEELLIGTVGAREIEFTDNEGEKVTAGEYLFVYTVKKV
jgi:isoleucyl-tRNA synthetase